VPSERFFKVRNLDKYQHYKDRNPPWIKLHQSVTSDVDFILLPDASKAHIILIWLLASRLDNRVPLDPPFVASQIGSRDPVDLNILILRGFLEELPLAPRKRAASAVLAKPTADASAAQARIDKRSRERENTERERIPAPPSAVAGEEPPPTSATPDEARKVALERLGPPPSKPSKAVKTEVVADVVPETPWSTEACDDWNTRFGGTAPGGRIGDALKPLVVRYSWAAVRPAWRRYLQEQDSKYVNPADFASKFGSWAGRKSAGKQTLADRSRAVMKAWLRHTEPEEGTT
jgi:hypothetical protein